MIALAAIALLVTFVVTLIAGRAYRATAFIVGSVPAVLIAGANLRGLGDPLVWFFLLMVWAPTVIAALLGAWLARLARGWRGRASR